MFDMMAIDITCVSVQHWLKTRPEAACSYPRRTASREMLKGSCIVPSRVMAYYGVSGAASIS